MPRYGLAVTVHDPEERILRRMIPTAGDVAALYDSLNAVCTTSTSSQTKAALRDAGFRVHLVDDGPIGEARRVVLRKTLEGPGIEKIQYADFDRILHWQSVYPQELRTTLQMRIESDYVALGRTARALSTHPQVQVLSETLTNAAYSAFSGIDKIVDVVAGSFLMSRRAAEVIVTQSVELTNATDLEWPALIRRELNVMPEFLKVEGLEFETADYYAGEIEQVGSREHWIKKVFDRPDVWTRRTELALDSIAAYARVMSSDGDRGREAT